MMQMKLPGVWSTKWSIQHSMDRIIAKKYLDWLKVLYPTQKIGLVWDYAGPHIQDEVLEYAKQLGIVVEFINKGMTSVQQPCDLYANQRIKQIVKDLYYEYRMTLKFQEQSKVKVPRELFVSWIERAVKQVHDRQRLPQDIRRIFSKCGLDPYDDEKLLLSQHLESLGKEALYEALTKAQEYTQLFF